MDAEKREALRFIFAKLSEIERTAKKHGFKTLVTLVEFAKAYIEKVSKADQ